MKFILPFFLLLAISFSSCSQPSVPKLFETGDSKDVIVKLEIKQTSNGEVKMDTSLISHRVLEILSENDSSYEMEYQLQDMMIIAANQFVTKKMSALDEDSFIKARFLVNKSDKKPVLLNASEVNEAVEFSYNKLVEMVSSQNPANLEEAKASIEEMKTSLTDASGPSYELQILMDASFLEFVEGDTLVSQDSVKSPIGAGGYLQGAKQLTYVAHSGNDSFEVVKHNSIDSESYKKWMTQSGEQLGQTLGQLAGEEDRTMKENPLGDLFGAMMASFGFDLEVDLRVVKENAASEWPEKVVQDQVVNVGIGGQALHLEIGVEMTLE